MKKYIYALAAIVAATACAKESAEQAEVEMINYSFEIGVDQTKVALGEVVEGTCPVQWENGDKVSIGWNTDADASIKHTDVTVSVSEGRATINFSLPAERHIVGAWYPIGGKPNNNRYMDQPADRGRLILPMVAYISGSETEWVGTGNLAFRPMGEYAILRYNFVKGNAGKTINKVTATFGGVNYSRTGLSMELTDQPQEVLMAIPASATSGTLKTTVYTSDSKESVRNKNNFTPVHKNVYQFPTLAINDPYTVTQPSKGDTFLRKGNNNTQGGANALEFGHSADLTSDFAGFTSDFVALMSFDLPETPAGMTLTSAKLILTTERIKGERSTKIYPFGKDFSESSAVYSDFTDDIAASRAAGAIATVSIEGQSNKSVAADEIGESKYQTITAWQNTFDVTAHVKTLSARTMNILIDNNAGHASRNKVFSKEAEGHTKGTDNKGLTYSAEDVRPKLVLMYE